MDKPEKKLILGLETGLNGGSVSILKNGEQIGFAVGDGSISRSEDFLLLVENLLKKTGCLKSEIGQIAVSDSPGSITGIRIGLAMAKGLGDSLIAKVQKFSVLEALAVLSNADGMVVSAIGTETNGIFFQEFVSDGSHSMKKKYLCKSDFFRVLEISEFILELRKFRNQNISLVLDVKLGNALSKILENEEIMVKSICSIRGNFGEVMGRAAAKRINP